MDRRERRDRDSRSRGRSAAGRRGERPPEPARPPRWKTYPAAPASAGRGREPPSGGGHRADVRDRSPRRSFSATTESGHIKSKSKPQAPPRGVALGQTSGVAAAGAWAARWEIATLLEEGCSALELVNLIRSGQEGHHVLDTHSGKPASSTRSWSPVGTPSPAPGGAGVLPWSEGSDNEEEWHKDLDKQQAILDALAGSPGEDSVPPWVNPKSQSLAERRGAPPVVGGNPPFTSRSGGEEQFDKKARPPPPGVKASLPSGVPVPPSPPGRGEGPSERDSEETRFEKPAVPPPRSKSGSSRRRRTSRKRSKREDKDRSRRRRRESAATSMKEKEASDMGKFQAECLSAYKELKVLGVQMELSEIVETGDALDEARFHRLTAPNKAATGLNYTRLMARFLKWRRERDVVAEAGAPFDSHMGVLDFAEHLVQSECGYLTPKSFLYAVDYFGTAFGYTHVGGRWNRAKRLAASYAATKTSPVSRAPGFTRSTMVALEAAVLNGLLTKPERVACGKLRLCIQSSTRFDDILNTPLVCCEWVRRPGEAEILGLRSRAIRGKSGPRAWIAAISGVDPKHDDWLPVLMKLVLESHGVKWREDDHMGKAAGPDDVTFLRSPSSLGGDVSLVKSALGKMSEDGEDVGLTSKELEVLRWHGAKASLSRCDATPGDQGESSAIPRWDGKTGPNPCLTPTCGKRRRLSWKPSKNASDTWGRAGDLIRLVEVSVDHQAPPGGAVRRRTTAARPSHGLPDAALGAGSAGAGGSAGSRLRRGWKRWQKSGLQHERTIFREGDDWSECLVDAEEATPEDQPEKIDIPEVPETLNEKEDPEDVMDELDTEGLTAFWVQAKSAGAKPLVHLPSPHCLVGETLVNPAPKCGISGSFVSVKAEEALEFATTLCRRCSASSTERVCDGICSHVHLGHDVVVRRCIRRCSIHGKTRGPPVFSARRRPKAGGAKMSRLTPQPTVFHRKSRLEAVLSRGWLHPHFCGRAPP